MPALNPYISGASGIFHGNNFGISNREIAVVGAAKAQYEMLRILLSDGAARAKAVIEDYVPDFASMAEYFEYVDKLNIDCRAVNYGEGNKISIDY